MSDENKIESGTELVNRRVAEWEAETKQMHKLANELLRTVLMARTDLPKDIEEIKGCLITFINASI